MNKPIDKDQSQKPVLVIVYGSMEITSYSRLVDLKKKNEKLGQPTILIPEPDENNQPTLKGGGISLSDISKIMKNYFGEGGLHENRDSTVFIHAHGILRKQGAPSHKHDIYGMTHNTRDLYEAILSPCKRLPSGVIDSSCQSGMNMLHMHEALNEINKYSPGKVEKLHLVADCRAFESSLQIDTSAHFAGIQRLVQSGVWLSSENLLKTRMLYSYGRERSAPLVEATFDSESLKNKNHSSIEYQDSHANLRALFKHLKNNPNANIKSYFQKSENNEVVKAISQDEFFKIKILDKIESAVQKAPSFKEFYKHLQKNFYGKASFLAREFYNDTHPENKNNMTIDKMLQSALTAIPSLATKHIADWLPLYSHEPKSAVPLLNIAARKDSITFTEKLPSICAHLRNEPDSIVNLINIANDPNGRSNYPAQNTIRNSGQWLPYLKNHAGEATKIINAAIPMASGQILAAAIKWAPALKDKMEVINIIHKASLKAPDQCVAFASQWVAALEANSHAIDKILTDVAIKNPSCIDDVKNLMKEHCKDIYNQIPEARLTTTDKASRTKGNTDQNITK